MNVTSNTSNMKTEVELYIDQELSDITFDVEALDEWKELTKELGLDNQLALTKGKESPVPFPYMNESMKRVYTMMCPTKVDIKKYDKTPIPLEVIKQIAFCKKENHFSEIEVWFDDKQPDPLVVGVICEYYGYKDGKSTENYKTREEAVLNSDKDSSIYTQKENHYLIARWGDVKRSFNELKEMAKERFIEKHAAQMKSDIETLTGKLKTIEQNATLYLLGEISESKATSTSNW